ncbi:Holliday junction DNA helicase subunit RuvA [Corynebacterium appendicis CIP 107643]|uniref:Holliday junction branch migration complex subunit RuvA n=1 Tax=Corynebacterium appendicis CIP 107643 TaxID=1161099 RepID=A0A1N7JFX6_9CORY|nr:Holliday junction branch migration protein RuvA [Corynebacterium appendicis]MCT1684349.1 Holliday junction branch migration protein RuvA [Corynebacterium appendicis]WJY61258.1 Holliday junction ATP-dependent DNA helicase RuvA [Corynebacterium appendicis CIP 107643]SIS48154.1 Holliday junction DNA helicase subunit RuvA [Corynebacterium appendicis CIP 107643]
MIDSLNGEVISIGLDHGVIECGGVGYRFLATPPTLGRLTRGENARVLTTMVVKEDAMTLYGFSDDDAREMFHRLTTVTGLGPKLALAALSVFEPAELAGHITAGNSKTIQSIPGVGKKMADRLVLELKDKLAGVYGTQPGASAAKSAPSQSQGASLATEQVVEALVGLGFPEKGARTAVDAVIDESAEPMESSALLRNALNRLGKK